MVAAIYSCPLMVYSLRLKKGDTLNIQNKVIIVIVSILMYELLESCAETLDCFIRKTLTLMLNLEVIVRKEK